MFVPLRADLADAFSLIGRARYGGFVIETGRWIKQGIDDIIHRHILGWPPIWPVLHYTTDINSAILQIPYQYRLSHFANVVPARRVEDQTWEAHLAPRHGVIAGAAFLRDVEQRHNIGASCIMLAVISALMLVGGIPL